MELIYDIELYSDSGSQRPSATDAASSSVYGPPGYVTYLNLPQGHARFCYAMSKMTVANEERDSYDKYDVLLFVEFLEMLGRIAHIRFQDSEFAKASLKMKLEIIIDAALSTIGEQRKDPDQEDADPTESDDDY